MRQPVTEQFFAFDVSEAALAAAVELDPIRVLRTDEIVDMADGSERLGTTPVILAAAMNREHDVRVEIRHILSKSPDTRFTLMIGYVLEDDKATSQAVLVVFEDEDAAWRFPLDPSFRPPGFSLTNKARYKNPLTVDELVDLVIDYLSRRTDEGVSPHEASWIVVGTAQAGGMLPAWDRLSATLSDLGHPVELDPSRVVSAIIEKLQDVVTIKVASDPRMLVPSSSPP